MLKHKLIILVIAITLITTSLYSQIYGETMGEQIEHWQGKNSSNIIDYVLKLKPPIIAGLNDNKYFLVIRTEIYGWNPVEYQIMLRYDYYSNENSLSGGKSKLMLIFEHPIGKSIKKQYMELKKAKPDIKLEEAASQINIKRDTAFIDSSFKYYSLIKEMYELELPIIYDNVLRLEGTEFQVYLQNMANEHYSVLPFGADEYKYTKFVKRLFIAMIDHFNAIDPYPDKKNK